MYDDNIITPTFTKLLDIRIVASKRSGSDTNFKINALSVPSVIFCLSLGDNEKKATSEPEISAEVIRRNIVTIILTITPTLIGLRLTPLSNSENKIVPVSKLISFV